MVQCLKVKDSFTTNLSADLYFVLCTFTLIFSLSLISDESFAVSHSKQGMLGMANKGPHTNASQFYITLQPTAWMDLTYVAFG